MKTGSVYPEWLLIWTAISVVLIVLSFLTFVITLFWFGAWAAAASFCTALGVISLVLCIIISHRYKHPKW